MTRLTDLVAELERRGVAFALTGRGTARVTNWPEITTEERALLEQNKEELRELVRGRTRDLLPRRKKRIVRLGVDDSVERLRRERVYWALGLAEGNPKLMEQIDRAKRWR